MAKRRKGKKQRVRYFFANAELHKILRLSRGEDLVIAWNYPQGKRVAYVWSSIQNDMQHAYSITNVSKILNRHPTILKNYIKSGAVRPVQKTYSIDERKAPGVYYMSEDDVREMHAFLLTVSRGRPRNDGKPVISNLPTKAELEAMLRHETVLYIKTEQGEFSPVWKQPEW
jgi:hypothetical protein